MRRPIALVLVTSGIALLASAGLGASTSAQAAEAPGSRFLSLSLLATAFGQRDDFDAAAGQPSGGATGSIPYTEATFVGSASHASASIAWPGGAGGNAGKLLLLLGSSPCLPVGGCLPVNPPPPPSQVTDQYHYLNDPIVANAENNGKQVDDQSQGSTVMVARANDTVASADGAFAGDQNQAVGTYGPTQASSHVELTGARTATADASSTVSDISIGGGVIKIGSVSSTAHASSNGESAVGTGSTVVSGMSVNGIPVTVDHNGISVNGTGTGSDAATAAVNQVITNMGFTLYFSQPTKVIDHGDVDYTTGSLILTNTHGFTITFGGAHVKLLASLNTPYSPPVFNPPPVAQGGGGQVPQSSGGGVVPPVGGVSFPTSGGSTTQQVAPEVAPAQQPVAQALTLPHGIPPVVAGLALLAAGLVGFGLKRLPTRLLEATTSSCPQGDRP